MRETRCNNGHIYDSDMYSDCPYCNGSNRTINFGYEEYNYDIGKTQMGSDDIGHTQMEDTTIGKTVMDNDGAENYGNTVAPKGFFDREDENGGKTVGVIRAPEFKGKEPVAGWLVCIDGPEKGKDYRIFCRVNTIGRSKSMDICINDPTVSRDKNARISYDPRNNDFHLFPAESSNTIYLNDRAVYVPTQLSAYDQIEFGKSKMLFIPLCGDRFHWNNNYRASDDR